MQEVVDVLYQDESIRVERIYSHGVCSPIGFFYDSPQDEWVRVVEGFAVLLVEGRDVVLNTGDQYFIPAHQKHSVKYTSTDCVWLCVYSRSGNGKD